MFVFVAASPADDLTAPSNRPATAAAPKRTGEQLSVSQEWPSAPYVSIHLLMFKMLLILLTSRREQTSSKKEAFVVNYSLLYGGCRSHS